MSPYITYLPTKIKWRRWRKKRVVSSNYNSCNSLYLCRIVILNSSTLISIDVRKKRQPQRKLKRRNDIYVNRKTDFAAHLERCQKSLDSRFVIRIRDFDEPSSILKPSITCECAVMPVCIGGCRSLFHHGSNNPNLYEC